MVNQRIDGAHPVDEQAPIVIVVLVENALGHHARDLAGAAHRVRCRPGAPAAALPARIHAEMRKARRRPVQLLMRKSAPAAIADELHHQRQLARALPRQRQPALDRMPAKAGKGDVEHLDQAQRRLGRHQARRAAGRARLGNAGLPEGGEIPRQGDPAFIGVDGGMDEIGKRHDELRKYAGNLPSQQRDCQCPGV